MAISIQDCDNGRSDARKAFVENVLETVVALTNPETRPVVTTADVARSVFGLPEVNDARGNPVGAVLDAL